MVQGDIIDADDHDTMQRGLRQVRTASCDAETRSRMWANALRWRAARRNARVGDGIRSRTTRSHGVCGFVGMRAEMRTRAPRCGRACGSTAAPDAIPAAGTEDHKQKAQRDQNHFCSLMCFLCLFVVNLLPGSHRTFAFECVVGMWSFRSGRHSTSAISRSSTR